MKRWFEALAQPAGRGDPYVPITVLAASRSTPPRPHLAIPATPEAVFRALRAAEGTPGDPR